MVAIVIEADPIEVVLLMRIARTRPFLHGKSGANQNTRLPGEEYVIWG